MAAKDESTETKDVADGSKKRKISGDKTDDPPKKQARKSAISKDDSKTSITAQDNVDDHDGITQATEGFPDDSLIFNGIKRIFSNTTLLTC